MKYLEISKKDIVAVKDFPVILVIGSTEQHGDHLPLGTDTFLAEYMLDFLNEEFGDKVLTLPVQWIGFSEEHRGFPGTLSLTKEVLKGYIDDLATWLQRSGFKTMIIINTHGGNEFLVKEAIEEWNTSNDLGLTYYDIWSEEANKRTEELFGEIDTHAGDSESSVTAAIRPGLVKDGVITDGYRKREEETGIDSYYNETVTGAINFKPDILVDKSKGQILLDQMLKDISIFIHSVI